MYFPVNFAKVLKAPFFIEQLQWLLLKLLIKYNENTGHTKY